MATRAPYHRETPTVSTLDEDEETSARVPMHKETPTLTILREHEETSARASRSSARGEKALQSARKTLDEVEIMQETYREAEDRIKQAGDDKLVLLGIEQAQRDAAIREEEAKRASLEERKRSISARRKKTGWQPDGIHEDRWK